MRNVKEILIIVYHVELIDQIHQFVHVILDITQILKTVQNVIINAQTAIIQQPSVLNVIPIEFPYLIVIVQLDILKLKMKAIVKHVVLIAKVVCHFSIV